MSYKGGPQLYGNQSDPNSPFYIAAAYGSYVPPVSSYHSRTNIKLEITFIFQNAFKSKPNHSYSKGNQECILSKTNLYIKGLPPMTTDVDLGSLCQRFG